MRSRTPSRRLRRRRSLHRSSRLLRRCDLVLLNRPLGCRWVGLHLPFGDGGERDRPDRHPGPEAGSLRWRSTLRSTEKFFDLASAVAPLAISHSCARHRLNRVWIAALGSKSRGDRRLVNLLASTDDRVATSELVDSLTESEERRNGTADTLDSSNVSP